MSEKVQSSLERAMAIGFTALTVMCGCSGREDQPGNDAGATMDAETPSLADSGGGPDGALHVDGGEAELPCGDEPKALTDYLTKIPEEGRSAVEVPAIGVNESYLFYLLSWSVTLDSMTGTEARDGVLMRIPLLGGEPELVEAVPGGGDQGPQG